MKNSWHIFRWGSPNSTLNLKLPREVLEKLGSICWSKYTAKLPKCPCLHIPKVSHACFLRLSLLVSLFIMVKLDIKDYFFLSTNKFHIFSFFVVFVISLFSWIFHIVIFTCFIFNFYTTCFNVTLQNKNKCKNCSVHN